MICLTRISLKVVGQSGVRGMSEDDARVFPSGNSVAGRRMWSLLGLLKFTEQSK